MKIFIYLKNYIFKDYIFKKKKLLKVFPSTSETDTKPRHVTYFNPLIHTMGKKYWKNLIQENNSNNRKSHSSKTQFFYYENNMAEWRNVTKGEKKVKKKEKSLKEKSLLPRGTFLASFPCHFFFQTRVRFGNPEMRNSRTGNCMRDIREREKSFGFRKKVKFPGEGKKTVT